MNMYGHGSQIVANTDAVLLAAGRPVVVYGVNIISDGTAGKVNFRDGDSLSGTVDMSVSGVANEGTYISFDGGIVFPNGCFVDPNTHVTPNCTVVFEAV